MRAMLKLCCVTTRDASELTDEDDGDENEVNTGDIIVNNVPECLEIIHQTLNKDEALNLKEFQTALQQSSQKNTVIRTRERPRISTVLSYAKEDICKDSIGYFLLKQEKQCRCQREGCKGKPKTYSHKCDKTLCQACSGPFHQN
ncbi:hypothetical protein TNCV_1683581 [Trichonephila clavipes]|nr:hypothetical protein TNCV_1683581 [Trichonephila clavipes]